ncbi:tail protein [Escherichia phage vB_EcoS_ESCO41]|uniref:Tail spike TSP1/Gp66 N-terminal domain-containing protein n=1 Tax=Escherichia phage vB_EcoS_ESCO41 TaxID=2496547 RepID=A0A1U9WR19_9CAUD|nr:tail protein [Escherichia phage vB_EcoS_ESCO41]AQY55304.1 hypothetical protein ESCO41_00077 [Escherichia phage vB_EcoS_ESCO41]
MAIYDLGTASLAANGEVTGVGTTWKAPLTLIRVGATIVFKTEPVQIYTISEIISDTHINVYNPNSETVPAGTGYAILAHDGITVQGLAQDVAETLRYYQSRETEVADAIDAFNNFDYADFESKVTQVNTQHGDVVTIAEQVNTKYGDIVTIAEQVSSDASSSQINATNASSSADRAEAAANSVSGTLTLNFSDGGTVESTNQQVLYINGSDVKSYVWTGSFPKTIPAGSTPDSTGGVGVDSWVKVYDSNLFDYDGLSSIGKVKSVSELSSLSGEIGITTIELESYVAGFNLGGGTLIASDASLQVNNVTVFAGDGVTWRRKLNGRRATVYDAGYTGDGDIAAPINSVNMAGLDCVVPVDGLVQSQINIDVSKGSLIGENKCNIKESPGAVGEYFINIFNSNTDYVDRDSISSTSLISGVSFIGLGARKFCIGGATSGETGELRIENCGIISTGGIEFLDNSYRILFDKCAISRSFNETITFRSRANSGEVMKFNHCWIVDNGGPITFENGQFIFDSCSLPAGKKSGYFDPTVNLSDNATVVFSNGNIEYQPGQNFVSFLVTGSSRLSIKDTTILVPDGFTSVPIVSNDDGVVILNNCSLPLYGSTTIASGFPARQVVGGSSKKVIARGCFPRAGFPVGDWSKGSIVSPYINSLSNGSGQFQNTSNWSLSQTSSGSVAVSSVSQAPTGVAAQFDRSFLLNVPDLNSSANFTTNAYDCEPGRYFQFGFWAMSTTTALASIRFLDISGNAVEESVGYYIPQGGSFSFYALISTVPQGAYRAEINFNVGPSIGSLTLHNVIYGLI